MAGFPTGAFTGCSAHFYFDRRRFLGRLGQARHSILAAMGPSITCFYRALI
jgi:hypothetical protein